jgi:hypothetical protein
MAGPWALDRIRASGVPYAVAPFFPDNGAPFLGVQGFCVNPYSENIQLAQIFLSEYIATGEAMQTLYEAGNRPSAFQSVLATISDPDLAAMAEAGVDAVPMPNIPEMGSVWGAWNAGMTIALTGQETPEVAMTGATQQIHNLVAGVLVGMVNVPGSYQPGVGCASEWDPACELTVLAEGPDGLWTASHSLPAGDFEAKVALDGSWVINYGVNGLPDGPNIPFSLTAPGIVTFTYDPDTHILAITVEYP